MRKSTLFVSAMLTVFLMATMFGVVSAYQQVVKKGNLSSNQKPVQEASQVMNSNFPTAPVATESAAPMVVSPEEATTIAVEFLGDSNVYSVEVVDYEGAPTYLVTFSSGDLVYVNSTGVVVANTKLEPVIVVASNNSNGGNGGSIQNNTSNNSSSGEHNNDDHEDHEEHENNDDD